MNLVHEAQESRKKIIISAVVALSSVLSAVPLVVVSGIFEMPVTARIALIAIAIIVFIIGIAVACILDRDAGALECSKCQTRFVSTMSTYINDAHTIAAMPELWL